MLFDFYLSEMSVSDNHGGGLTLQRVLGEDLVHINHFFHTNRFASDYPPTERFLKKSTNLFSFWEGDFARKLLGRTASAKIFRSSLMGKLHVQKSARLIDKVLGKNRVLNALICPQGLSSLLTLEYLKKRRNIAYISWVMDDHLVSFKDNKWYYPKEVKAVFAKHLREARHVFVISSTMQQFYKEEFGVESTVLFGPADLSDATFHYNPNNTLPLRIGYFGAVAAWQHDVLKSLSNSINHSNIQLHIYSNIEKLPGELPSNNVILKGRLRPEEVLSTMKTCSAILLPMSFTEKMRNMSQFNIATKMSECLASGIPVLAIGPEYAAMVKFLKKRNAAIVITNPNISAADLRKSIEDKDQTQSILKNARETVLAETGTLPMKAIWNRVVNT